jgi:D-alanyl-D-alanine carboxypeptidase
MSNSGLQAKIDRIANRQIGKSAVGEIAVSLHSARTGETIHSAAGTDQGLPVDHRTPFFLASTTKLFATAIILQLQSEGRLQLDDPAARYLSAPALSGLHAIGGREFTGAINIRHLLAHTSGLPDYFEEKRKDQSRLATGLLAGHDAKWSVEDVIAAARDQLVPHFPPGEGRRAFYSDTNYQLLGQIIELLSERPLSQVVEQRIAARLQLSETYLFEASRAAQRTPVIPLRNGTSRPAIPLAIESTRLDGGGVSTSAELLELIRAFFGGKLFPSEYLPHLFDWRAVFFPLQYGVGVMRFKLPWLFSPFAPQPELLGHSGISGAFAFYCPERDAYLAGTVSQLASRSLPYRFMLGVLGAL